MAWRDSGLSAVSVNDNQSKNIAQALTGSPVLASMVLTVCFTSSGKLLFKR
jgi:hypothetical protein